MPATRAGSLSLGSCRIVAFVATSDAGRARTFYEGVLGLRLVAEDEFALIFDAAGTTVRVTVAHGLLTNSSSTRRGLRSTFSTATGSGT